MAEEQKLYECEICVEDITKDQMFQAGCGHMFCLNCWYENFREHVRTSTDEYHCLKNGCKHCLDFKEIVEGNLHNGDMKLLDVYSTQISFAKFNDEIIDCPKCFAKLSNDPEKQKACQNEKRIQCPMCQYEFCRECHSDYHPQYSTCDEYRQHLEELKNSEKKLIEYDDSLKPCRKIHTVML